MIYLVVLFLSVLRLVDDVHSTYPSSHQSRDNCSVNSDVYYPMDDRHHWESRYSPNPYPPQDWHDPNRPARGASEFYPPLYEPPASLPYSAPLYAPDRSLPLPLSADEGFSPSLYDFSDLNHMSHGYGDAYQDPYRDSWSPSGDAFWVNVPSQPFDAPVTPRGVFGLSDNLYLDPMDVDGMSSFNSSTGVYAPKLHSRAVDALPSFQTSRPAAPRSGGLVSSGTSTISPPVHLSPLWSLPVYRQIWNSLDESKKLQLTNAPLLEDPGDSVAIKRLIDRGIQEKKSCRITRARTIFVELVVRYSRNVQVWLEFCRLEMECGEYSNARVVLETASTQHPNNELLLQKRLRVEERLRSVENVIIIINELQFMDTQKSMKILVEGIGILAKLGYEKMAFEFSKNISTTSKYFTGNLYLEMMLGEQRSGSMKTLMQMIDNALVFFPKYGPLWFFCFNLTEHLRQLQWDKKSMMELISVESMEKNAQLARDSLTVDILWKVFLLRVEYWYRTCMFLRQFTFDNVLVFLSISLAAHSVERARRSGALHLASCESQHGLLRTDLSLQPSLENVHDHRSLHLSARLSPARPQASPASLPSLSREISPCSDSGVQQAGILRSASSYQHRSAQLRHHFVPLGVEASARADPAARAEGAVLRGAASEHRCLEEAHRSRSVVVELHPHCASVRLDGGGDR